MPLDEPSPPQLSLTHEDGARQTKNQRALERKRAADRDARRLERSRTKEHIARLEERLEALLRKGDPNDLVEKLLQENEALNIRIFAYQKQINSARLALSDVSKQEAKRELQPAKFGLQDDHSASSDSKRPSEVMVDEEHSLQTVTVEDLEDHQNFLELALQPFVPPISPGSCAVESDIVSSKWSARPRTDFIAQHPSPLSSTSVYRTSGGSQNFHYNENRSTMDMSFGHTIEDVIGEEKVDMFFGRLLPVLNPNLQVLYRGISECFSTLNPQGIIDDLLSGTHRASSETPPVRTSNIISLIRMSLAEYAVSTIREAYSCLSEEQKLPQPERVAIFWIMLKILTWMAFPTLENYSQIPPWYRPTQAQLSIPHPSYIDLLVFPLLRDKLVYTYANYDTAELLLHLNSLYTLVWEPGIWLITHNTPLIALRNDNSWEFQLEPNFERAIWDLRSWRMLPAFVNAYPEFMDCVQHMRTNAAPVQHCF